MYYRFQSDDLIQTSYHPYPDASIINLYKNMGAAIKMIDKINSGEVAWDDVCNFDDVDNYRLIDDYVCCHVLEEENQFNFSGCAASDDYVIVFDSPEEYRIFDGFIAKCDKIDSIYKKINNKYVKL